MDRDTLELISTYAPTLNTVIGAVQRTSKSALHSHANRNLALIVQQVALF